MEGTEPSKEDYPTEAIGFSEPSIVALLRSLDLTSIELVLLEAYSERDRRPPYPPVAMLRALIFQKIRQISSWRKLARTLRHEKTWLPVLGFQRAPCHDSFSEFTKRVGPKRFRRIFLILQSQLKEKYPGLGQRIAVDSTIVKGYSNPNTASDPDAKWGVTGQRVNKPVHVFGYKLQISSDADFGIPLDYLVVPANRNDSRLYREILLRTKTSGNRIDVVIADAGYDSKKEHPAIDQASRGADNQTQPEKIERQTKKKSRLSTPRSARLRRVESIL